MNMEELQYLADHLHPEECRRLFASVHFHSYEVPDSLEQTENQVSRDIPCIRLLVHWNSAVGEGRGETHDVIEHRLRQMGKQELADWLGRTVFHQLSQDLVHSLQDPFHDMKETEEPKQKGTIEITTIKIDVTEWLPVDTIFLAAIGALSIIIIILMIKIIWMVYCKPKRKKKKTRLMNRKRYKELDSYTTDEDSEDVFDVRTQKK